MCGYIIYYLVHYCDAVSEILCLQVAWKGIINIFTRVFGNAVKRSFCSCGKGKISTWGFDEFVDFSSAKRNKQTN